MVHQYNWIVLGYTNSWTSQVAQWVKNHRRCRFDSWVKRSPGGRHGNPTLVFLPGESHGKKEPGGLQSIGSQRIRQSEEAELAHILKLMEFPKWLSGKESACQRGSYRWCELDSQVRNISWRRTYQLTPVFLPGESHGSLLGYNSWVTKSRTWLSNTH